ncbi:RNA polymerase sigma factor [Hufsiella ginkgonis]|uniref:Sigma-70 family RNA polymerase sigma factor n=1 Tax=Hufsiella ginkgonis TaxID=2695274 RepID=A0A7K1XUB9_9SPHI|nr:RNA polymerase sigma factor [Hufsiella ginkgonis]MXV14584.1 sigma-70 family RNA polymerase sigma factor [Hufsiella ginkgonis]
MKIEQQHTSLQQMVEGCQRGDRKQQEQLYRAFASPMFGICLRYGRNREDAEDILQNGFIRVFEKIGSFRNEGSLEGWIKRIMVHTGIECYRKNRRTELVEDISEMSTLLPQADNGAALEVKEMIGLISRLPGNYRTVFNLYAIDGYSHREIAGITGMTELASRTSLCRAREILRQSITGREVRISKLAAAC